ncbi:trypsin-1-like [Mytilus galloprovincialis]|uniref:trypsin-1-like n=1 Tax=Mytilus galloprovincialis TaxID=29158 RepID=UPI003F7C6259
MRTLLFIGVIIQAILKGTIGQQSRQCGVQTYQPHTWPVNGQSSKIIGGREAVPHSWPWQVVLRFRDHPLTCSGTLVNNNSTGELVVLTAAQCVDGTLPVEWTIDVGVHSRSAQEQYQKTYDVKKIISHPEYSPFLLHNDIAIVRLSTPVVENEAVAPICVTSFPSSDFYGKYCVVTGWGATSEGGSTSDRLKEVYKPVLTDTDCLLNVGGTFNSTTMLCAGFVQGGEGTCTGDDGGPLACKNVNGQWDLIGIVSWGYLCARESYPAVYTDVHHFLDWIGNSTLV